MSDTGRAGPPAGLRGGHDPVLLVVSPPRCASTAVARCFWGHPAFRWYCHEPFDRWHHEGASFDDVRDALDSPLDVGSPTANGLVVKEMTFQAGVPNLLALARAATLPVVVTVRDPRLAIASRARQRRRGGLEPEFPAAESGWFDLAATVAAFRDGGVDHVVVEATELRRRPGPVLRELVERLGLPAAADAAEWKPAPQLRLGRLNGTQDHWYERVLGSHGIAAPDDESPDTVDLPPALRALVPDAMDVYRSLVMP